MILVDIQVPVLDEIYDFELDEETEIDGILGDILNLIARKEQICLKDEGHIQLYALRQGSLLDKGATLKGQGVRAGDRLILI